MNLDVLTSFPAIAAATFVTHAPVPACVRVEFLPLPGSCLQFISERILEDTCWAHSHRWCSRWWPYLYTPITALVSDSSNYVVCPWSVLLSATGSLSFQDRVSHIEAAPFKAPELLQGQSDDEQHDASQVRHMVSLQHQWGLSSGKGLVLGHPQLPAQPQGILRQNGLNEFFK